MANKVKQMNSKALYDILKGGNDVPVSHSIRRGDMNAFVEAGIYSITTEGTSNHPSGAYTYGLLLVFEANYFGVQLYFPDRTSGKLGTDLYFRVFDPKKSPIDRPWMKLAGVEVGGGRNPLNDNCLTLRAMAA